jgi:hypothetical protein
MAVVVEELVDLKRVNYLLDTYTFDKFLTTWDGKKKDAKVQYENIIKYLNFKVLTSNNFVKYNYCKKRTSGRLIGINTIQSCLKNIRGFICDGITTDVDMINAHPTILLQLCKEYDIQAPNLTLYISKRKDYLNDIIEKDNVLYEDAKKKVLVSTNMDTKIKTNSDFLKNYDNEMKQLHKKFLSLDDFRYVKEFAKTDNFEGSFINHILCIYENIILTSMQTFCTLNNIKIHSLMFDGLMVYGDINDYTLKLMQKFINENTIFVDMKLSIKQHEYNFILPDNYNPGKRITYEELIKDFERDNCKVGSEFVCEKHNNIKIYKKMEFMILHEELTYVDDKGDKVSFIEKWVKDADKRKYDIYDTIPKDGLCPDYVYNMWKKLPVEIMPTLDPSDYLDKSLSWFLSHIKVLVDYNEEHYNFVCMWIAQMFQYPENKSIHLVFVGEEGTGKGTFVKFFTTMLGGSNRCFSTSDPQEDVFGKFNDSMKDAFLVIMNEADKAGTYNNNSKFKDLIDMPNITIRPKGHTPFTMKSVHRFMSFSNNADPSIKNKRRDFTMRTSSDKVNNQEYFTEGNKYANDLQCCKYIYDYFKKYEDVKPNIMEKDIPKGDYDTMLKEEQKEPLICMLEDLTYDNDCQGIKDYTPDSLYNIYSEFCTRTNVNNKLSKMAFCTRLAFKRYDGITKTVKKFDKKATNVYTFDFGELTKSLKLIDINTLEDADGSGYDTD